MSRIGKKPIIIEKEVKVYFDKEEVHVEGPKGKLAFKIPKGINVSLFEGQVKIAVDDDTLSNMQGLFRSLLQNAVHGVTKYWHKTLELVGVGFRAETDGQDLTLSLGFSHPIKIKAPPGINFTVAES